MTRRHLLFDEDALASESDSNDENIDAEDSSLDNFIVDDDIDDDEDDDEDIEFDDLDSDDFEVVNTKKAKARTGLSGRSTKVRKPKSSSRSRGRPESSSCASGVPESSSCSSARPPSSPDMMTATPTKNPRGRPRSAPAVPATKYSNPPGHPHYPINNFSLTVSKLKQDVAPNLLDVLHTFLSKHAIKSGLSTEVGHRAFNLHLQGTFSMRYPSDATAIADLSKLIKREIKETVKSLTGYRVVLKALGRGQAFSTMIGYVTKDEGQPHYQIRLHNVSRADLDQGRREHTSMLSNLDDNKKIINMKNFFNECYRFNKRCFAPVVVPIDFALLYMMQSQNYILTPDFIAQYRKMDFNEATTLWRMIHEPTQTSIEDVRAIVFDPRTYDNRRTTNRYYMSGALQPTVENAEDTFHDAAEGSDGEENVVTSAVDRQPSLATRLVSHMRQANISTALLSTRERLYPSSQQDIIPLPDPPSSSYHVPGDPVSHICPPTVDEMMNFVRGVRETVSTTQSAILSAVLSTPRRREDSTDVEEDTPAEKRQRHNYDMFT